MRKWECSFCKLLYSKTNNEKWKKDFMTCSFKSCSAKETHPLLNLLANSFCCTCCMIFLTRASHMPELYWRRNIHCPALFSLELFLSNLKCACLKEFNSCSQMRNVNEDRNGHESHAPWQLAEQEERTPRLKVFVSPKIRADTGN